MEPRPHEQFDVAKTPENQGGEASAQKVVEFSHRVLDLAGDVLGKVDASRQDAEARQDASAVAEAKREAHDIETAATALASATEATQVELRDYTHEGHYLHAPSWQEIDQVLAENRQVLDSLQAPPSPDMSLQYRVEGTVGVTTAQTQLEQQAAGLLQTERSAAQPATSEVFQLPQTPEGPTEQQMAARVENVGRKWLAGDAPQAGGGDDQQLPAAPAIQVNASPSTSSSSDSAAKDVQAAGSGPLGRNPTFSGRWFVGAILLILVIGLLLILTS